VGGGAQRRAHPGRSEVGDERDQDELEGELLTPRERHGGRAGHTPGARAGSTAPRRRLGREGHPKSVLPEDGAGVSSASMARALVALLGVLFVATRAPARQVEVTVEGLLLDPSTGSPVVRLVEKAGSGKLAGDSPTRELPIAGPGGKDLAIDARPSDAIALALRFHGPILVSDDLFAKAAATHGTPAAAHLWGITVQDLTPEMASFFQADDVQGVLVSDVE